MKETRKQCKDCMFLDEDNRRQDHGNELLKCGQGGYRRSDFPACRLFIEKEKSRQHNDDVNMFSRTDVKGGEE